MNRTHAKKIAEIITNEQLQAMLNTAKALITDWTKTSVVNKGMTKGTAWNILGSDFDINFKYHNLAKVNMVREFGEYLPAELKPSKKTNTKINPVHQDPIF